MLTFLLRTFPGSDYVHVYKITVRECTHACVCMCVHTEPRITPAPAKEALNMYAYNV